MVISLWGFMGAGKSTIGRLLGQKLGWRVVDTDQLIEAQQQKKIAQIFAEEGEEAFRQLENKLLMNLIQEQEKNRENLVLITGGGLPVWENHADLLKQLGSSVFIDVPFEEIVKRLKQDTARPLWNPAELEQMKRRYDQRYPLYSQAQMTIKVVEQRPPIEVANEIAQLLQQSE